MYGEIDLELYTISIIRLNSTLERLENNDPIDEIKDMFYKSFNDLNQLYADIVDDLNQSEINVNEYYLFFQNGKQTFPQYIEVLEGIENSELHEVVNLLLNLFSNLNKIADGFFRRN